MANVESGDVAAIEEAEILDKMQQNFRDWTIDEVHAWLVSQGFSRELARKFKSQNILGRHLPYFLDNGGNLQTSLLGQMETFSVSEQIDFKIALETLLGNDTRRFYQNPGHKPAAKQKLSIPAIKGLDEGTKSVYLAMRSRVRRATEIAFPGNNIPTFRNNRDARTKLENLVKELTKTCCIMQIGFGEDGIRSHIMSVLNERRRMVSLGHSYESQKTKRSDTSESPHVKKKRLNKSYDEDGTNSINGDSTLSPQSASSSDEVSEGATNDTLDDTSDPSEDQGKEDDGDTTSTMYLTNKCAEIVVMTAFKESTPSNIKLHRQILPACRQMKLTGYRGKSKQQVMKILATALIHRGYVCPNEPLNRIGANPSKQDFVLSTDKDIGEELKVWLEQKKKPES